MQLLAGGHMNSRTLPIENADLVQPPARALLTDRYLWWLAANPARICAIGIALVAALQLLAYWPGLMQVDATLQYDQAISGQFEDWHPPLMAWLWRQILPIWPGPAPMLLLQATLYWGGFGILIAWALRQKRAELAFAILACALMPISVARLGSILKDCLMAGALLMATALIAWTWRSKHAGLRLLAAMLIVFAAAMRANAFMAGAPLLVMLLPEACRRTRLRFVAAAVATTLALASVIPLSNKLLDARNSDPFLSLIIFDMGGITAKSSVNVFPAMPLRDPVAANRQCYTPRQWDGYGWWGAPLCPINFDRVRAAFSASGQSPSQAWIAAIAAHPIAYAEHRLAHFNLSVRFLSLWRIKQPLWNSSRTHYLEYQKAPNLLLSAFNFAGSRNAEWPLGWPVVAMGVAAGVILLGRRLRSQMIAVPLAWSCLFYGGGYLLVGVAAELRYHMWTTMAGMIAGAMVVADIATTPAITRKQLFGAAAPLIVILVLAIGARLLLVPGGFIDIV